MLKEIAITPDVWLHGAFSSAEHQGLALTALWKGVERGAIIRDLCDGQWFQTLSAQQGAWHPRAKEVIKHLRQRIVRVQRQGAALPAVELDWLNEAYASHKAAPHLSNIFLTDGLAENVVAANYGQIAKGTSKLPFCEPFSGAGCSVKVKRNLADYVATLSPVFRYSNVIAFIDPYITPGATNYAKFPELLRAIAQVNPTARVEIHRELADRNAPVMPTPQDWFLRFSQWLRIDPQVAQLAICVHIWDEFHDRYLVSDLIGISVPYGFDTTAKANDMTRWTMLSRADRDDVFQEFSGSDPEKRRRLWEKRNI